MIRVPGPPCPSPRACARDAARNAADRDFIDLSDTALISAAQKETGLLCLGDTCFKPGLRAFLLALEAEAQMSPLGRLRAKSVVTRALKHRLWANAGYEAHPEILRRNIVAPIIIVGPIHSGATRVMRMLAADPRIQHAGKWESFNLGGPRIEHPVHGGAAPSDADEDLLLLPSFCSLFASLMYMVPSYTSWLLENDKEAHYRDMANLMRLLSWRHGVPEDVRWVLQAPLHMLHIDSLLAVFPDAKFVFTQRDPLATVASTMSLSWSATVPGTTAPSRKRVRTACLQLCEEMARRCMVARASIPAAQQCDVYHESISRAFRAVQRDLYDFIEMEFAAEASPIVGGDLARSWNEDLRANHLGSFADFGVTADEVDARMMFVREHYGLDYETGASPL